MNFLDLLSSFERSDDTLEAFKLLTLKHWYDFENVVLNTRHYERGYEVLESLKVMLDAFQEFLSPQEHADIDKKFIRFELVLLDKLDRWPDYLEFFDFILETKEYVCVYVHRRKIEDFGRFYLRSTPNYHLVHFLYVGSHRYDVIKRKMDKFLAGKPLGNLKHHTQDELTDDDLAERFQLWMNWSEKRRF